MGKVPPVRRPHMGTPPLVRKCTPEEESSWPLGPLLPCHVSTAMALRTSAIFPFLGGHSSVRIGQNLFLFLLNIQKRRYKPPFTFFCLIFASLRKRICLDKTVGQDKLLVRTGCDQSNSLFLYRTSSTVQQNFLKWRKRSIYALSSTVTTNHMLVLSY